MLALVELLYSLCTWCW